MSNPSNAPPTVLIVEDEPLLRMLVADVFVEKGLKVIEAPHAAAALTVLKDQDDVDVLFTDINMPGDMNGIELAQEVRERWPAIAVMITSGRQRLDQSDIPETGTFVPKPYNLETVADYILKMSRH